MLATTDTATATGVDADRVAAHPVCRRIKAAVLAVEPEAEVLLFGSRARGDAREDSDWDVLVLVAGELHEGRRRRISDGIYDAVTARGFTDIVNALIRERDGWHQRTYLAGLPAVVDREGVRL